MAMRAFHLPDLGEGMAEAEIIRWKVAEGERVEEDQPLVELETDKAVMEIPSPYRGILKKHGAKEGERLPVGAVLAYIEEEEAKEPSAPPQASPPPASALPDTLKTSESEALPEEDAGAIVGKITGKLLVVEEEGGPSKEGKKAILASPAVRRRARELGLPLEEIQGTGPQGRITQKDLEAALERKEPRPAPTPTPAPAPQPAPTLEGRRIPLRGLRRTIAQRLSLAHQRVPQVTHVDEVDVTELVQLRKSLKEKVEPRLTYLPFVARAAVKALQKYPFFNASLDEAAEEIVLHPHVHLGIAVDTEEGLLVAVLREAERLNVVELAREIPPLVEAARKRALPPEKLRGSTFTITSVGSVGGLFATPIVNYPEVAILGVHKIVPRPQVREGKVVIRDTLYLTLSFDHRVIDGVAAVRFTKEIASYLEEPAALLWEDLSR